MAQLARITLFPIKALDGLDVSRARVSSTGALEDNRRYAVQYAEGHFLTGKTNVKAHQIRTSFDLARRTVTIGLAGDAAPIEFHLDRERDALSRLLSGALERPVRVVEDTHIGFPDDTDSTGPTVISTATLEEVARWFPGLTRADTGRRFRTTLEIGDTEPFWEERLYGEPNQVVRFRVGEVLFEGVNPCRRCVVPTRDPESGAPIERFMDIFQAQRAATLPAWAARSRFDHYYRLAVNTRPVGETGGTLHVGDRVEILGIYLR